MFAKAKEFLLSHLTGLSVTAVATTASNRGTRNSSCSASDHCLQIAPANAPRATAAIVDIVLYSAGISMAVIAHASVEVEKWILLGQRRKSVLRRL
jgi:hypothetical protein